MSAFVATLLKAFAETAVHIAVDSTKQAAEQVLIPEIIRKAGIDTVDEQVTALKGIQALIEALARNTDSPEVVHAIERIGAVIPMRLTGSIHAHVFGNQEEVSEYMHKFYPDKAFMGE